MPSCVSQSSFRNQVSFKIVFVCILHYFITSVLLLHLSLSLSLSLPLSLSLSLSLSLIGEIITEPSVDEVKKLLLCPFHMITQSLVSCVQPLFGMKQKTPLSCRPTSQASALLSCMDAHSTGTETRTPVHQSDSPIQESKKQV